MQKTHFVTLYFWHGICLLHLLSVYNDETVFQAEFQRRLYNLQQYARHLLGREDLIISMSQLRRERLGCWCHRYEICHGHLLLALAEFDDIEKRRAKCISVANGALRHAKSLLEVCAFLENDDNSPIPSIKEDKEDDSSTPLEIAVPDKWCPISPP